MPLLGVSLADPSFESSSPSVPYPASAYSGGYEGSGVGWYYSVPELVWIDVEGGAYAGDKFLRLRGDGTSNSPQLRSEHIPVTPGEHYRFGVAMARAVGTLTQRTKLQNVNGDDLVTFDLTTTGASWSRYENHIIIPAGCSAVRVVGLPVGVPAATVMGTLTTALAGANNDIVWTGKRPYSVQTVQYQSVSPDNATLTVSVGSGDDVVVTLRTSGGTVLTTAQDIIDAVAADETVSQFFTAALAAGNDGTGAVAVMAATTLSTPTADDYRWDAVVFERLQPPWTVVKTADEATSSTAFANVTDLSFPVTANHYYDFEAVLIHRSAATTTGIGIALNGPSLNYLSYHTHVHDTDTGAGSMAHSTAYDTGVLTTSCDAANTDRYAFVRGTIQPSVDGTVALRFKSEVSGSAVTVREGSHVRYEPLL